MWYAALLLVGVSFIAQGVCLWAAAAAREGALRRWLRLPAAIAFLVGVLALTGFGAVTWFCHRSQPPPLAVELFPGVHYQREVRREPRPLVIHVVKIALDTPGLEFLVTPRRPTFGCNLAAQTTGEFLQRYGLQLAVNGGDFHPWHSDGPFDYYPHSGDPVEPRSIICSRGTFYGLPYHSRHVLYLSRDNRASIDRTDAPLYNALSGMWVLLRNGRLDGSYRANLHPRTAIGLDRAAKALIIVVVDGRQPGYSEGVTLAELAELCREAGCDTAINMDGGGSSTLVAAGSDGRPRVLNSPIHCRVPGWQRPIATHLGIAVKRKE